MAQETVLVVDDSTEMHRILKTYILEPLGYRVLTAVDGEVGLRLAVAQNPDLILLDMNMPRVSGLEMLAALRNTTCKSPVIFMTVEGSEQIAVEAFRLGVRDYLRKPFTPEEVRSAIDNALRESRLASEREELSRNLVTAEAVRLTVVTLSHYLNNYLMVLYAGLSLLDELFQQKKDTDPTVLQIVKDSYNSAKGIEAVLKVLRNAADVNLTNYANSTSMIDIQAALEDVQKQIQANKASF